MLFHGLVYIQVQCCGQEKVLFGSARHEEAGSLTGGGGMEKESHFLPQQVLKRLCSVNMAVPYQAPLCTGKAE